MLKNVVYILIAVLLAVDNVFIKFRVMGISYDRILLFVLFFAFFKSYLTEVRSNPFFRKWNVFLVAFALLQLIMNLKMAVLGDLEFEVIYTEFIKCFSFLAFSFLFILIAKKNTKYVNVLLFVHFLICVFAFLQHPYSPVAAEMLDIKKLLYSSLETGKALDKLFTQEVYIEGGYGGRFRLSGPFVSATGFSYFAITSFIMNFYMYIKHKRKMYLLFLIVVFLASVFSQTRSLLLGELCIVFGYLFFMPTPKSSIYKFAIVSGAVISSIFLITNKSLLTDTDSRLIQVSSQGQGDSRPLLWLTGLYTVINHPFGVTPDDHLARKKDMFRMFGNPAVIFLSTHHGLINLGFHYSILGYVLFFFLVLFLLKNINYLNPQLRLFFKLALLGYLINATFHNNFILNADYPFLMVLMLISPDLNKRENVEIESKDPSSYI